MKTLLLNFEVRLNKFDLNEISKAKGMSDKNKNLFFPTIIRNYFHLENDFFFSDKRGVFFLRVELVI